MAGKELFTREERRHRGNLEKENTMLAVAPAFFMWGAEGAESTETFDDHVCVPSVYSVPPLSL
jgi:hypothetical protein